MRPIVKTIALVALLSVLAQLGGCASSSLADVWHDPAYQAPQLRTMLVISVRRDATKRRIWEDAFTAELAEHGVAATSSYSLFADAPPDSDQAMATVQANGFEGIMVIRRLPTETSTWHVKGYTTSQQQVRYSRYWQQYRTYYSYIDHPGYTDSQTVDIRSIDVTTTGTEGRLIWSATSRTPDPGSVTGVQKGIASLAIAGLARRGIIADRK
jgi:hypothetical protein